MNKWEITIVNHQANIDRFGVEYLLTGFGFAESIRCLTYKVLLKLKGAL